MSQGCPYCGGTNFHAADLNLIGVVTCDRCNADCDMTPDGPVLNTTRPRFVRQAQAKYPPWVKRQGTPA